MIRRPIRSIRSHFPTATRLTVAMGPPSMSGIMASVVSAQLSLPNCGVEAPFSVSDESSGVLASIQGTRY